MFKNINLNIQDYIENSPKFEKIEWYDLSDSIKLHLNKFPNEIKKFGNFITVRRLKQLKRKKDITNNILSIKKEMTGNKSFRIKFPILLNNKVYVRLYALMVSEGSYKTEFSLNVPEKEFHIIFKDSIKNLMSDESMKFIKVDNNNGILRSRAPAIIRHIIPFPSKIPSLILKNKGFAREYLKIAFEAEGSPILDKKQHKRYIKISRYIDITQFLSDERLPLNKRIYIKNIKEKYSRLFNRIKDFPPKLLLGEQILLKYHFDINSSLKLEAIRKNKTDLRCGKITARWVLFIYADNINKFIEKIGFILKKKRDICKRMMKIPKRRQQYFSLQIINNIQKNNFFSRKDFCKEMKKLDYKCPQAYLWRYEKKGLIKRIKRGHYKLIYQLTSSS